MLATGNGISLRWCSSNDRLRQCSLDPSLGQKHRKFRVTFAGKRDFQEESRTQKKPDSPFNVPFKLLAQSGVAVLALGFVDAGYSGDWSRIGVISRYTEDVLKAAAFVVIPLCLGFIFYLSKDPEEP